MGFASCFLRWCDSVRENMIIAIGMVLLMAVSGALAVWVVFYESRFLLFPPGVRVIPLHAPIASETSSPLP